MARPGLSLAIAIAVVGVGGAPALRATAQRIDHTTVRDVRITAHPVNSSVRVPREPEIEVRNGAAEARTVEIVAVESMGAGETRVHSVTGRVRWVLRPGARAHIRVSYRGEPTLSGQPGLPWHRFRVRVRVDGERGAVITTTAYVCRIPVRHGVGGVD